MRRSLPPNVHEKNGRYYLVTREAGKRKWRGLTRVDAGTAALYKALAQLHTCAEGTIGHLINRYLVEGTAHLAERTRVEYSKSAGRLREVFGHVPAELLEPTHIAQYLHRCAQSNRPVQGNRDISVLRNALQFGLRLGLCRTDPCLKVRRNKEKPRERYVSDEELLEGIDRALPEFRLLLWAAYLTGLRQGDLKMLRKEQLTDAGIVVRESKRGKRLIIAWSDALRALVDEACARHPDSEFVLNNTRGERWTTWAIQSAMRRLNVDWNFHDLRAKAESDHATGLGLMPRYKRARIVTPVS